jgi:S-adenosylmethionine-dependent methyltransferase
MAKQAVTLDRNFDGLAARFKKNIYGGLKGQIRLAVLARDFAEYLPITPFGDQVRPLRILDAGGGQGQFSLALAEAGHQVVLCDISADMLAVAAETLADKPWAGNVKLVHCAIQQLAEHIEDCQFDLVLCHAVMEWMAQPETLLPTLASYLKTGGHLSLTFYNRNALIYKNLLRTNYKKVRENDFAGSRGSLTPISPMQPIEVESWLQQQQCHLLVKSGIRVFHDYILDPQQRAVDPAGVLEMELALSRQAPYVDLGRYIHLLARKE